MPALPCPLPAELPLAVAMAAASGVGVPPLGVWFRSRRPLLLVSTRSGGRHIIVIDGDLGRLLRRCASVIVRLGPEITVVSADELLCVRTLSVVAEPPSLPTLDALRALFPDARDLRASGVCPALDVPLAQRSAEEVLATCAAARTRVLSSRIVYGAVGGGGAEGGEPAFSG